MNENSGFGQSNYAMPMVCILTPDHAGDSSRLTGGGYFNNLIPCKITVSSLLTSRFFGYKCVTIRAG